MSQSNSNTESKRSSSEQLATVLLHLSTGACVIVDVFASTSHIITGRCPMELDVVFDEEGDVRDFMMRPYLHPFSAFKAESLVNFNVAQVCSISEPHPLIQAYYYKSLNQIDGNSDDEPSDRNDDEPETKPEPVTSAKVTLH